MLFLCTRARLTTPTPTVRNTLYSDQWDDKERIFNMHLNATLSLVQSRVNALRELNVRATSIRSAPPSQSPHRS